MSAQTEGRQRRRGPAEATPRARGAEVERLDASGPSPPESPDLRAVTLLREHEEAARVPEPRREEYRALRADIERRGVVTPLEVTAHDIVLDGRQRLRAARELGLRELPVRVVAPADELGHMLLAALQRRHLTPSQRAALALELADYEQLREEARRRQLANLRQGSEVATLPPRGEKTRELAARRVGASGRTVQDAITVKEGDPALFQQVIRGKIPVSKAARRVRQAARDAQLPADPVMPEGPFELIYADPPWQLGGDPEGPYAPENHYPTMPLEEIKALALPAAEDAVLFLWTPAGLLPQALEVMAAWGFEYRSEMMWLKPSPGLGNWVRNQHEPLLIGRRGSFPAPERELRPSSVLQAPRGRHSQKPELAYELIERMYPHASKLELFARKARPGWAAFGNEVAA